MTALRVGIVGYPTYGGSGVVATELGCALAREGHVVHLFSYAPPVRASDAQAGLRVHAVDVFAYPLLRYPPYDLALASKILEVAGNEGLDVVHAHYAVPHAIAAFLAREVVGRERMRTVTTLHGTDITLVGADPSYRAMTCFGIARSDAVTCVSEHLRQETLRTFDVEKPIEVIPNFVDASVFRPLPAARGGDRSTFVVSHVSNFRPVKRLGDVVETFARVAASVPARLLLVGDGPDRPLAERLVRARKVADRVEFLGEQPDVASILARSDVFLLASETESFGLSALEAMACGVPVVAPAVGGLPEVVLDGETGLLPPPGDVGALAEACLSLARDPPRLARMGEAARARAVESFAPCAVVARYVDLYRRVLSAA